jgi:hypothetical protein
MKTEAIAAETAMRMNTDERWGFMVSGGFTTKGKAVGGGSLPRGMTAVTDKENRSRAAGDSRAGRDLLKIGSGNTGAPHRGARQAEGGCAEQKIERLRISDFVRLPPARCGLVDSSLRSE